MRKWRYSSTHHKPRHKMENPEPSVYRTKRETSNTMTNPLVFIEPVSLLIQRRKCLHCSNAEENHVIILHTTRSSFGTSDNQRRSIHTASEHYKQKCSFGSLIARCRSNIYIVIKTYSIHLGDPQSTKFRSAYSLIQKAVNT
jgi:hypothetical protein